MKRSDFLQSYELLKAGKQCQGGCALQRTGGTSKVNFFTISIAPHIIETFQNC